jgi:hypothetical protein
MNPGGTGLSPYTGATGLNPNPFANPYANPFLNPYAAPFMMQSGNMTPGNAGLFFFAAQKANGGIGSGQIGGPYAARAAAAAGAKPTAALAEGKSRGEANVPGAGASRYFGRTQPMYAGTERYYNRQGQYFPSNKKTR